MRIGTCNDEREITVWIEKWNYMNADTGSSNFKWIKEPLNKKGTGLEP
jgi:hypothetical protein